MKSLLLCLPLLLCGCLSDAVATAPRQAEFIELGPSPRTTAVEPSSRVPAVASPVHVTLFISDTVTQSCNRRSCSLVKTVSGVHDDYWKSRSYNGNGFHIATKPVTDEDMRRFSGNVPCYLWMRNGTEVWVYGITPDQLQSSFDQTPKE